MPSTDDGSRPRPARSVQLATGALGVATVGAPLLFGGIPGWTVPVIAALAGLATLAAAWATWRTARPFPYGMVLVLLVGGVVWTAIQAVPLPCSLVAALSPDAAEAATRTASLFEMDARCTLSEDPGRAREEVLKGLALVSLFVASCLVSSVAKRDAVLQVVATACVSVAVAALAHTVFAAQAIWGIYRPLHGSAALGPFVSPNHLGGLMALGAPVAIGLALSSRHRTNRLPWALAATLMLAVLAVTLSRGALLAGALGLVLFGAMRARHEAKNARDDARTRVGKLLMRPAVIAALPLLVGVAIVLGVVGIDAAAHELGDTDASKLGVALRALELAIIGPWVGVGRGAFTVAFVEHADTARVRYEYAENFPAQWAMDWGIVVGPLLAVGLTYAVVRAVVQADRPHLWGALAGLCAYATQNLVDYGLEVLGSAAVGVVLLGASVTPHLSSGPVEPRVLRRSVALAAVAGALTLAAAAVLGRGVIEQRVDVARAALEQAMEREDREGFARALRSAASLHPREPVFPLLAGAEAARHGDGRALAYLNRAMQLAPGWIAPRLVAGQVLAAEGHFDQGLLEMREALERDVELSWAPACALLRARPTADTLLRMAARNERRRESLVTLVSCLPPETPDADDVDLAILEIEPGLVEPRIRMVDRALHEGRLDDARRHAGEPSETEPAALTLARARVHLAAGEPRRAREAAERAEANAQDPWPAVALQARALAALGEWGATRDAVGELRGLSGSDVARLGDAEVLLGDLELAGGHRGQALAAYEDAWRSFERLDALVHVAELASALGDEQRALGARQTLCEHDVEGFCPAPP